MSDALQKSLIDQENRKREVMRLAFWTSSIEEWKRGLVKARLIQI